MGIISARRCWAPLLLDAGDGLMAAYFNASSRRNSTSSAKVDKNYLLSKWSMILVDASIRCG